MMKCINYEICQTEFGCIAFKGICACCSIFFNKHKFNIFVNVEECPICYDDNKKSVNLFNCSHKMCIDCFRKLNYELKENEVTQLIPQEPAFPYPELHSQYLMSSNDEKWYIDPKIVEYIDEWDKWDSLFFETQIKFIKRECPLCRKPTTLDF